MKEEEPIGSIGRGIGILQYVRAPCYVPVRVILQPLLTV
jgi:hypothetical protein